MIVVELSTVTIDGTSAPNLTEVTPVKPVPVMVTEVPPVAGPEGGDTEVMVGA